MAQLSMTKAAIASRKWRADNPDRNRALQSTWKLNNKEYSNDYQRKRQGLPEPTRPDPGLCEICGQKQGRSSVQQERLCLDHDHLTNLFRGWLCHKCNLMLGRAKDSVEYLQSFISYLQRNSS